MSDTHDTGGGAHTPPQWPGSGTWRDPFRIADPLDVRGLEIVGLLTIPRGRGGPHTVFGFRVPAHLGGDWRIAIDGTPDRSDWDLRVNDVEIRTVRSPDEAVTVALREGDRVRIAIIARGQRGAGTLTGMLLTITPPPPAVPVNLRLEAGSMSVEAAWDAVPGATSYEIRSAANAGALDDAVPVATAEAAYTIPGLAPGARTHVQVRAHAGSSVSAWSAPVVAEIAPDFQRHIRETAPAGRIVAALEIRHPAIEDPVRVVNDAQDLELGDNTYTRLRFEARLADDVEGRQATAQIVIDNIGQELTQWIERAQGGPGATVRILLVAVGSQEAEWEAILDVTGVAVDQERVTVTLGYDPLLGRPAVTLRHDPETSPGLF